MNSLLQVCRVGIIAAAIASYADAGLCQGVELTPDSVYRAIEPPPLDAGATPGTAADKSKIYTIPLSYFPPPGFQGSTESCVGWAVGYTMMGYMSVPKSLVPPKSFTGTVFSPWYLYLAVDRQEVRMPRQCQGLGQCGIRADLALQYLQDFGTVPIEFYPTYPIPYSFPPPNEQQLNETALKHKIPSTWHRLYAVNNPREIKSYISVDIPIISIIEVDRKFMDYRDNFDNRPYQWKGPAVGTHAMVVIGYNDSLHAFRILNSHGDSWGKRGYGWIDYESYIAMVRQNFIMVQEPKSLSATSLTTPKITDRSKEQDAPGAAATGHSSLGVKTVMRIRPEDFAVRSEETAIKGASGLSHYTFSVAAKPELLAAIKEVTYIYKLPGFPVIRFTSREQPYFSGAFDVKECLTAMTASLQLANDSIINISFDGCDILRSANSSLADPSIVNVIPYVTATHVAYARRALGRIRNRATNNKYDFEIQLRGIERVITHVDSVTYFWNHPTFNEYNGILRLSREEGLETNFSGAYSGWGCLDDVIITLYFNNRKTKVIHLDMCNSLGWSD
ncbi:C1 family peptidase [Hymenobacter sp. RP-2-7]|uniref:C1 family peptidase n=1 Tax=Hymenobacter polaris TaxID=2682546 RepID=A0A7Y0AEM7_9BACT|nr:C1 family peptidase [Hymenobacter polaris]NML65902.1 C1 family peptidase [Hymenobacter polaris]